MSLNIRKGNPEFMREINRALILDLFRNHEHLSQAQVSRELNLSKSTVSRVVNKLIEEKTIVKIGEGEGKKTGGRKPVILTLNPQNRYVIGIDLGTTNTVVAMANLNSEIIKKIRVPTNRNHNINIIISQLSHLIEKIINNSKVERGKILGIGIAEAGMVDTSSGIIKFSPNFNWENVNIAKLLEEETGFFTLADNCTRIMSLGEIWHGNGKKINNMFYVNIGYGIGSALIIDGKIYDNHSEFGHIPITDEKVRCGCGKYGCLEAVASGNAIERKGNKVLGGNDDWFSAKNIANLAKNGNSKAENVFKYVGNYLGKGIAIVSNIFNPDKVILGGGVSRAGSILLQPVQKAFEKHSMKTINSNTKIELSTLGMDAGVYGAITLILNSKVFHTDLLNKALS